MNIVEELRNKKSRDNRDLLDKAADKIEELELLINNPKSNNSEDMSNKQIEEIVDDLMACHTEFYDNAEIYTDYYDMAQNLIAKGYRKQSEGEWIRYPHNSGIYCSLCKHKRRYRDIRDAYCPHCGAKMKGGAE